jgi:glycosyltransferase involved in cell wall biosynthesis
MALGLPAILSDIPAHRQLFRGETPVAWVDPASPADMAQRLGDCMNGMLDLPGMAARGRAFAARFTPERMAMAYRDFYSAVLAR